MASAASKKLLKELPPEDEMMDIIMRLLGNSDQAVALTGAAYLDHALELLLSASFRKMSRDERDRLFDGAAGGILGTFSSKIRLAFATRLIAPQTYHDLLLLNDIRNVFAHTLLEIDFDHKLIAQDCANLQTFRAGALTALMQTAKERYGFNVFSIYVGLRKNVERHAMASVLRDGQTKE